MYAVKGLHMKRKSIILLSSILAGSLLVGGAFAAYAVTDNADPFGINVTPGNIDEDTTKYVTLEWGESTNLEGVGLLKVDEYRRVGVVSLASSKAYTGKFTINLKDNTGARTSGDYMFSYLEVFVYQGDVDFEDPAHPALPTSGKVAEILPATAEKATREKEVSVNLDGSSTGAPYTVFVHLTSGAASDFGFMSKDVCRITVDWGAKSGDTAGTPIYVAKPATTTENNWDKIYVYAWKDEKVNAAYPGVEMVPSYTGTGNEKVYEITIPTGMEKVIFNNGLSGDNERKLTTEDIVLSTAGYNATSGATYFNGTAFAAKPAEAVVTTITATKKVGAADPVAINLDAVEMTDPGEGNKKGWTISLNKDEVVEFKDGNTTIHFYHWDGATSKAVDDGTQFTAHLTGEHSYNFYYNNNDQMFVSSEVVYYLVGLYGSNTDEAQKESKWTDTTRPLTKINVVPPAEDPNEYKIEGVNLYVNDKVKVMSSTNDYYPGGDATEYIVTVQGVYTIYFRPNGNGNNDWHESFLYLAKTGEIA